MADHKREDSNIELSPIDQKRSHNVALDNTISVPALPSSVLCISAELLHVLPYFLVVVEDSDTMTAVR